MSLRRVTCIGYDKLLSYLSQQLSCSTMFRPQQSTLLLPSIARIVVINTFRGRWGRGYLLVFHFCFSHILLDSHKIFFDQDGR